MDMVEDTRLGRSAAFAAVAVLLVAALVACGSEEKASATSFQREPAGAATGNPFMAGVDTAPASQQVAQPVAETSTTAAATATSTPPPVTAAPGSDDTFAGDTPGLYGGTRQQAVCDATKMAAFLEDNPDQAAAWAKVLGIEVDDIEEYIALLTPTVLRADTAVTNHGFRDGVATSVPAVLQAGTAVFVDDHGAPVVKCSCGNPLTPAAPRTDAAYTGPSWKGFDASSVTAVSPSPEPLNDLTLVDTSDQTAFTRPIGTDGDADVPYSPDPVDEGTPVDDPATTTTTSADDATTTSTTTSSTTTTTTTSSTTTAPTGEDVSYDVQTEGVGGVCAGVPGSAFALHVIGGRTVVFSGSEQGPVQADGSFDFTLDSSVGGGLGGTVSTHFTGRIDQGPPWGFQATREDTVTSPTGSVDTCTAVYTGTRRGAPAETTTTTSTTTTLAPLTTTTISRAALQPLEQTWYFTGHVDEVRSGCDDLGITLSPGPAQRIRVRWSGDDDYRITFLGRPSRTMGVNASGEFEGQLIAPGEGDPDQMGVSVGGGPVPRFGDHDPAPFPYTQIIGEATSVPGTFDVTVCRIDFTARPT